MRQRQLYIKNFGDLVNTAAPIHVKQDSLVHNVLAKFVTMPGEKEEYTAREKKIQTKCGKFSRNASGRTIYDDLLRYKGVCSQLYKSSREECLTLQINDRLL